MRILFLISLFFTSISAFGESPVEILEASDDAFTVVGMTFVGISREDREGDYIAVHIHAEKRCSPLRAVRVSDWIVERTSVDGILKLSGKFICAPR